MKRRDPIAQFSLVREIRMRSRDEREITLAETSTGFEAEPTLFDLATQVSEAWPGDWQPRSFRTTPLLPAPWGEAPRSGAEYARRVAAMVEQARTEGFSMRSGSCIRRPAGCRSWSAPLPVLVP